MDVTRNSVCYRCQRCRSPYAVTHGSVGAAILVLSLGVRLLMLPLSVAIARQALVRQARMKELEPRLKAIQATHADDPERQQQETLKAYQDADVLPDLRTWAQLVFQGLLGSALYSAIHAGLGAGRSFLWVADLARPDMWVMVGVVALTVLGASLSPGLPAQTQLQARLMAGLLPAMVTAFALWNLSAGLGL